MHFKSAIYIFGIALVFFLPQAVSGCSGGEVVRKVGEPVSGRKATQKEYHEDLIDFILEKEY